MDHKQLINALLPYVQRLALKKDKFVEQHNPEQLSRLLHLDQEQTPENWEQLFSWIEKYCRYSVDTGHPGFVNRMWAAANLPSVLGEIVTALTNTSACTFESAPVATLMEEYMLEQMLTLVGFDKGEGQMTTGSSNGNMIAMLAARNLALPKVKQQGLNTQAGLVALASEDAHYSLDKAANILGIGTNRLAKVPLDSRGRMEPDKLEEMLQETVSRGDRPFFVAATLGTTVRGAYDSLPELLELRNKYGFWLHADGAWGGAVVLHPELRARFLSGIEEVDSFTWDFHKMLGTNLMCNMLLLNGRQGVFHRVCGAGDGSYLFREEQDEVSYNTAPQSLQCGRRVDSLKWFLDWKFFGQSGLADRISHYLSLCEYAQELVSKHPELELTAPRESFNVCFRFKVPLCRDSNQFNTDLRSNLYHQGKILIGMGYIGSILSLRLLITNPAFNRTDVEIFFDTIVANGKKMLEEL